MSSVLETSLFEVLTRNRKFRTTISICFNFGDCLEFSKLSSPVYKSSGKRSCRVHVFNPIPTNLDIEFSSYSTCLVIGLLDCTTVCTCWNITNFWNNVYCYLDRESWKTIMLLPAFILFIWSEFVSFNFILFYVLKPWKLFVSFFSKKINGLIMHE